jgi:hypothetical protein
MATTEAAMVLIGSWKKGRTDSGNRATISLVAYGARTR